jgi:hypothetical protein
MAEDFNHQNLIWDKLNLRLAQMATLYQPVLWCLIDRKGRITEVKIR